MGIDGLTDDLESLEYCLRIDAPLASLFLDPSLYHGVMAWQIQAVILGFVVNSTMSLMGRLLPLEIFRKLSPCLILRL